MNLFLFTDISLFLPQVPGFPYNWLMMLLKLIHKKILPPEKNLFTSQHQDKNFIWINTFKAKQGI